MTLKVGVIGIGGIAATHMPGWAASTDAEVVAGADLNSDALKTWGEKNSVKKRYTDAKDLIADPDIDIVDICTPNTYHAPLAIASMDAGKHVICEKPLAVKPAEIRDMIVARDRTKKMLMTAQHMRFSGSAKALKREIETGTLGDIYHARSWMLRRCAAPTRPGFIMKKHSGGGPCIDIGVHVLDLTLWMMGNPKPTAVTGVTRADLCKKKGAFSDWGGPIPAEMDVEEFASAFVRFENGATLILEVSWLLHHDVPGGGAEDKQVWLYGTNGGCHWPRCEFTSTDLATVQHHNRKLLRLHDEVEPHALECIEFARAIVQGAPSPVPAEQSLQVQSILDGIYESQKRGGEVRLSEI